MKVTGTNTNNIISIYTNNKNVEKKVTEKAKDSVEISSVGKSLSAFAGEDGMGVNSSEKVERIRNEISNGTYKSNSKLTSQKMIDIMKGREV